MQSPCMKTPLRLLPSALCLLVSLTAQAAADYTAPYVFSTLAGTSSIGSRDGTGAAARFYSPRDLATDSAGNVFIVDQGNHVIRKMTPAGVVSTFAGTPGVAGSADGLGAAARFANPQGIVADPADNLYVADTDNHTIRRITPAGQVTTLAGLAGVTGNTHGPLGTARFHSPRRITRDQGGNLFVTDSGNHSIRRISPEGTVSHFSAAYTPETTGAFTLSFGAITAGADGSLYGSHYVYSDTLTHAPVWGDNYTYFAGDVSRFAADGTKQPLWSSVLTRYFDGRISNHLCSDLEFDPSGRLVVVDGYTIKRTSLPEVSFTTLAGDGLQGGYDAPALSAKLGFPLSLSFDRNGTLYIADTGNNVIRKLANDTVTTLAGLALENATSHRDASGSEARLALPFGMAVDAAGNVFVADQANHCIRRITPEGAVTTLAGKPGEAGTADGTGSAARFSSPTGIAIDVNGVLYVSDNGSHVIRKVTPGGETSTFAGSPGQHGWDDGPGATARFWFPYGIAVDLSGNLYVASASTVRKVTPDGTTTTLAGFQSEVGHVDGQGAAARFAVPYAVAADRNGNVYVTEAPDGPAIARIRKISPGGHVTTLSGGEHGYTDGSASAARFHNPYGLAVDAAGNLFVADCFNQVIRRITPEGAVSTLAGLADSPGSTDGTGTAARFHYPRGLAVGPGGSLYVSSATTIRKGVPAAAVTISTQPVGLTVPEGNTATFSSSATGTPAPSYQWQRNGVDLPGATGSSLSLNQVRLSDAGDYTVVVTNDLGSITSAKATLTVTTAPVTPPPSSGGGGGGGAPSWWFVGLLGGAALLRSKFRRGAA